MILFNPKRSKAEQMAEMIKLYIKDNSIAEGSKLPSIARFASIFSVGKDSINDAIAMLSYEGIVVIKPCYGVFVAGSAWKNLHPKSPDWPRYSAQSIQRPNPDNFLFLHKIQDNRRTLFNLLVNNKIFPDIIRNGMEGALQVINGEKVQNNHDVAGWKPLREELCKYMSEYGLDVSPDQVFITQGNRDSVNAVSAVTMHHGMEILYGIPSLALERYHLSTYNIRMTGLPTDSEGIMKDPVLKNLKNKHKKMLYVTPSYSIPSGITTSLRRREELLRICRNADTPIIEMDSYRNLSADLPPALAALDKTELVIYIGSLGEILPRGINISWIVVPRVLVDNFYHHMAQKDYSAWVTQAFFYSLLKSGEYNRHKERFREYTRGKRTFTRQILEQYIGDIAYWDNNGHPLIFWVKMDERINMKKLYNNLELYSLRSEEYVPGYDNYIAISSMNLSRHSFIKNIKHLSEVARTSMK